jgi:hypothetical protein
MPAGTELHPPPVPSEKKDDQHLTYGGFPNLEIRHFDLKSPFEFRLVIA